MLYVYIVKYYDYGYEIWVGGERGGGGYKNLPMNREEGRVVPIFSRNQWKFTDPETRDKDYYGTNIMVQVIEILKKEKSDARFKYGGLFYPHKMGKLLKM